MYSETVKALAIWKRTHLTLHFFDFLTVEHVEIFVAAEVVALHLFVILLFIVCLKKNQRKFKDGMCDIYWHYLKTSGKYKHECICTVANILLGVFHYQLIKFTGGELALSLKCVYIYKKKKNVFAIRCLTPRCHSI